MQFLKAFGVISTLAASVAALPVAAPVYQVETTTVTVVDVQPQPTAAPAPAAPGAVLDYAPSGQSAPSDATPSDIAPAAPSSTAITPGGIEVVNNMDQPAYLWSVDNKPGVMKTLAANIGSYFELWRPNPDNGGISLKVSLTPDETSVLQLEYTYKPGDPTIWYDGSVINLDLGSAFIKKGYSLISNDPSCPTFTCAPDDFKCAVYWHWNDDKATHSCNVNAGFKLILGSQ